MCPKETRQSHGVGFRQKFGKEGEDIALKFLLNKGYEVLTAHYWTRFGELDLVMKDHETVVFVEVKRRENNGYGRPEEAVTWFKRNHLTKAALLFIKEKRLFGLTYRFDLVSLTPEKILHIPNAFMVEDNYYY